MSPHARRSAVLIALIVAAATLTTAAPSLAVTCDDRTWMGAEGASWTQAENWSPPNVPDTTGECAVIPVGGLHLDSDVTVGGVTLSTTGADFAAIGGSGTLTVDGTFTWHASASNNGGHLEGTGRTVIKTGGHLVMDPDGVYFVLDSRTLEIQSGAFATLGAGNSKIVIGPDARIENAGSFFVNSTLAPTDGPLGTENPEDEPGLFDNKETGTFTKTSPDKSQIYALFHNDGQALAMDGLLSFQYGDGVGNPNWPLLQPDTGTYGLAAVHMVGAEGVAFAGGVAASRATTLGNGAKFTDGVSVGVPDPSGGCSESGLVLVASGAEATAGDDNPAEEHNQVCSGKVGGPGTLRVAATSTLHVIGATTGAATLGSGLALDVDPGATVAVDGPCPAGGVNLGPGSSIENAGTVFLQNGGYIAADWGGPPGMDPTLFHNVTEGANPPGTFEIRNHRGYYQGFLNTGPEISHFDNDGRIHKSGDIPCQTGDPFPSVIDAAYSGAGDVDIDDGKLSIPLAPAAVTATLQPGSSLSSGATTPSRSPDAVAVTRRQVAATVRTNGATTLLVDETTKLMADGQRIYGKATVDVPVDGADVDLDVDSGRSKLHGTQAAQLFDVVLAGKPVLPCPTPVPTQGRPCIRNRTSLLGTDQATAGADARITVHAPDNGHYPMSVKGPGKVKSITVDAGGFSSKPSRVGQGEAVDFKIGSPGSHKVRETQLLANGSRRLFDSTGLSGTYFDIVLHGAGRYSLQVVCGSSPCDSWSPTVPVFASSSSVPHGIRLTWSDVSSINGATGGGTTSCACRYTVRYRYRKSSGANWSSIRLWRSDLGGTSATFVVTSNGMGAGQYQFFVSMHNGSRSTGAVASGVVSRS
jgi:hypothetical protein